MKQSLIVGSAGRAISLDIIRSVRERFGARVFVVAIDSNPRERVAASVIADRFVRVPWHGRRSSYQRWRKSPRRCSYLPIHDQEIEDAADLAEHLSS
jgi:hypothetical protein